MRCIGIPLLIGLTLALAACAGGTFFIGANTSTGHVTFVSGTVSIVQVTAVAGDGSTAVQVTVVTLLGNGMANSLTFCGDNRNQFPMNSFVGVNFTPAQPCVSSFVVSLN